MDEINCLSPVVKILGRTRKLEGLFVAMDFVYDKGKPRIVEISYGFSPEGYDPCPGYWDKDLNWHKGRFDPYGWIVNELEKPKKRLI